MTKVTTFRRRGVVLMLSLVLAAGTAPALSACGDDPPSSSSPGLEEPVQGDTNGDGITDYGGSNNYEPATVPDLD